MVRTESMVKNAPSRLRFTRAHRIRSGRDFARAYDRRQRAGDDVLLVFGCENQLPHPRLGLSVSRKVGRATVRNRWKRLLREAFRLSQHDLPSGVDLVVIPRPEAKPTLESVRGSLRRLARKVSQKLKI
jgi:ribonuclease P protein component